MSLAGGGRSASAIAHRAGARYHDGVANAVSSLLALIPDQTQRRALSELDLGHGLVLHVCSSVGEAERLQSRIAPDVVIAGRGSPAGWLNQIRSADPDAFLILGAEADGCQAAIDAVNRGEADAILRCPADPDEAVRLIHRGCESALLRRHNRSLVDELAVRNSELLTFNERLEELVAERTHHLVQAQERVQEQQRQVVQLETQSTVTHLLRGLAHEFNNPLAAIFGYTQRLRRIQADDPEVVRRLEVILQEVDHCRTVVQQLSQLATPLAEAPGRTEPAQVVQDACERLQASRTTPPTIAVAEGMPDVIAAPRALARVFEQVLANAVDAGATTVSLEGSTVADRVHLVLCNDGATPDEVVIANAVRPFFTTRAAQDHRGLGLSTAAALLREQDGTIELAVRPDGRPGAAVIIVLPAADPLPQRRPSSSSLHPVHEDPPPAGSAILVVDDEAMISELLVDVLRERGHATATAASVADAVVRLAKDDVAALIVDIHLPDGSGIDLARRALALKPGLLGHIALTTGESDPEALERLVAEHGFPVLAKPFRLEAVGALADQIG